MAATEPKPEDLVEFQEQKNGCFIVGYTGEVGKELLKQILEKKIFARVVLLGRREMKYDDELYKDVEQHIVDFDNLMESKHLVEGLQHAFCCLGTTLYKAGKAGLEKMVGETRLNSAKLAQEAGVKHFHLVSASGANAQSRIKLLRMFGEVDESIQDMEFENTSIYRPALLMCNREETRIVEGICRFVMKPISKITNTGSIPTSKLTNAMINAAVAKKKPQHGVYDNIQCHALSDVNLTT